MPEQTDSLADLRAKVRSLPEPMKALLREELGPAPEAHKRWCYAVFTYQRGDRGYIPSVVTEDEAGHAPLIGNGEFASPWYWGEDFAVAERVCAEANEKLGLTADDVHDIVNSSIAASIREQAVADAREERLRSLGLRA